MSEWCEHSGCSYRNRLEYCELEAGDPDGAVSIVIELLDTLLYGDGQITSDVYHLSTDSSRQVLSRNFSYVHGDGASWVWPLMQTQVAIDHVQDKRLQRESYVVQLDWHVEQHGVSEQSVQVTYGIDMYAQGAVQAYIDEPDFIDTDGTGLDGHTTRRMVDYDYTQLFDQLSIIRELHAAERLDNSRVEQ